MTPKKRILLADDSATALTMHRMILGGEGYDILTAKDGQEAIEIATEQLPDLILMDIVMPRKTGFEAVRALRQQAATRDIPIIMVTTRAEPKVVEICFQAGCKDYVNKPVDAAELLAKVRSALGN
jgi:twitching motility two-component system response regulator PilH